MKKALVLLFFLPALALAQLPSSSTSTFEDLIKKRDFTEASNYLTTLEDNHTQNLEKAHIKLLEAILNKKTQNLLSAEIAIDSLLFKNTFKEHLQLLAETWLQKGHIASINNDEDVALKYFQKVDSLGDQIKTIPKIQIMALGQMADYFHMHPDPELGFSNPRDLYEKALKIATKQNDSMLWYNTKIKVEYLNQGKPQNIPAAIGPIFEKAKQYFILHDEKEALIALYGRVLRIYLFKDNPDKTEQLCKEFVELVKDDDYWLIKAYYLYGYYFMANDKNPEAIEKYQTALATAKTAKRYSTITYNTLLWSLAEVLKREGQYKEALTLAEERYDFADSLSYDREIELAKRLDTKYQTRQKEQEIALLSTQNKLSEQKRKNQKYIYAGVVALLLASAAFLFFGFRNKIKTARKLNELNQLKSRFFANISHEFRTPLTLIKSPVQQLKAKAGTAEQKQLGLIDHNADRMLELVDQLLELSKIESGNLRIILKQGNLSSFLNGLVEPFVFKAKEDEVPFELDIEPSDKLHYFDRDILTKVIVNLLSNAFKYGDKGTAVGFKSKVKGEQLHLEISNVNKELTEGELRKLFDRFYQNNTASTGYGIGLAMVKDLVELYKGSINTSLDNGKVVFSLKIPLNKTLENAVVIEQDVSEKAEEKITPANFETDTEDTPIMLIADDNADIRSVLKDLFKKDFKILEAQDGNEAFQTAQDHIPDCIITDVMMPKMDGYTLVKKLKENELTSSVPVILLTAKSGDDARLQGLKNHADAYLTKPFNHDIVKEKVKQLLYERQKLKERYSQELVLKPTEVAVTTADQKFIKRLEDVLETHLTNPEFPTNTFAESMGLSRMQLHRKLKSLLGVSATEYLRNERLKTAAKLLGNKKLSVSDVAYNVGFNDVGYFSKSFKETYGLSPSAFRKKKG